MSCKSSFVIYSLFCQNCNAFYIGKSEKSLHIRINGHRHQLSNPTNESTIPFIRHVKLCSNNFSVIPIFQSEKSSSYFSNC